MLMPRARLEDCRRSGLAVATAVALMAAALAITECGGALPARPTFSHDEPVPAGEPRAALRLRVDLLPAQGCEEAFDLALYRDRAVDLIQWDGGASCVGRVVVIRYLPRKLSEAALLAAVRAQAAKADVLPLDAAAQGPPTPANP